MNQLDIWKKKQIDSLDDICLHHKIMMDEDSTTRYDTIKDKNHKYYKCYVCKDPRVLKTCCKDYRSDAYYEAKRCLK